MSDDDTNGESCGRCGDSERGPDGSTRAPAGSRHVLTHVRERVVGVLLCPSCLEALEAFLRGDDIGGADALALLRGECPSCGGRVERVTPHKHSSIHHDYFRCRSCGDIHDLLG